MKQLLLASILALALFTAHALAASTGSWTGILSGDRANGEGSALWKVTAGGAMKPAKGQDYIWAPSDFQCNTSNLSLVKTKIPVEGGKFVYKDKAYVDVFRAPKKKGDLTWKGEYTSGGKVSGTIRFVSPVTPKPSKSEPGVINFKNKECDTGKIKWHGAPGP